MNHKKHCTTATMRFYSLDSIRSWSYYSTELDVIFVNVRIVRRVCRAVRGPVRFKLNNLIKEALIKLLSLSLEHLNNSYIGLPTENSFFFPSHTQMQISCASHSVPLADATSVNILRQPIRMRPLPTPLPLARARTHADNGVSALARRKFWVFRCSCWTASMKEGGLIHC